MQNQAHGVIQPMVIVMAVAPVTRQRVGQSLSGSVRGSSRMTPYDSQCEGSKLVVMGGIPHLLAAAASSFTF
jgi:hypothetical protein